MLKCDFFSVKTMYSNVTKKLPALLESLWSWYGAHTRRVPSSQFDYCAVEFVHKFCENTMWHFFQTFHKTQLFPSIFLWNRHVTLTNFQRIVNVLWVLLDDFAQKITGVSVFFPCLFWNQVSSVLSPPSLLSFTWWTVVARSHCYSRESSHRRSTWRGCAHW